jgi:hypothetical protein
MNNVNINETTIGKCGRCDSPILPHYVWCDRCEDVMLRVSPAEWKEREDPLREYDLDATNGAA